MTESETRELSDDSAMQQALAYVSYAGKEGARLTFDEWADSKDMGPADRRAVAERVTYVLMRGRVQYTDVTGDGATEATASGEAA